MSSAGPRAELDGRGLLLVTAAAFAIVWGLVRGKAVGWGSVEVVMALVAGAAFGWRLCSSTARPRAHAADGPSTRARSLVGNAATSPQRSSCHAPIRR